MRGVLAAIAAAILLTTAWRPSPAADRVTVMGYGTNTCGAFVSVKPGTAEEEAYLAWLGGFLSGANVWNPLTREDVLKGIDLPAVKVWMQNYCRANPLETVFTGALKLGNELIERRKGAGGAPNGKPKDDREGPDLDM